MKCPHFSRKHCFSCDLLAQEYVSSVAFKEQKLGNLFPEHKHKIKSAVICDQGAQASRNKAKLAVAYHDNQIEFGFYDQAMQFKKLEDCLLHTPAINDVLASIKTLLVIYKIIPYDLTTKKGELKYLLITYSGSSNELLLRFILRSKESLDRLKLLVNDIQKLNPIIKVITANIQGVHQAILEGEEEIVLTESDCITHYFDQYTLFQGPRSFFQTNSAIALQLYKQFQYELSSLTINSFLDLYCGVGAFSFFAEKYCSQIIGVEISGNAIYYANKARKLNNSNIDFVAMDAELFLKNKEKNHFDAVMMNPPRRGLNKEIIANLIRLQPAWLFYSSCNVETLHRDLLELQQQYEIQSLQVFDMFPFTSHFETLAVLKCI